MYKLKTYLSVNIIYCTYKLYGEMKKVHRYGIYFRLVVLFLLEKRYLRKPQPQSFHGLIQTLGA